MTDLTEPDSGVRAVVRLLLGAVLSTVKQAVDVLVGSLALVLFSAGVSRLAGLSLTVPTSAYVIQQVVYFGGLALFVYIFGLGAVILPEELIEYVERDELEAEASGVRGEVQLAATDYFNATYKASLVLVAGFSAALALQYGLAWLATLIAVGLPVGELAVQVSDRITPLQVLTVLTIVSVSPLVFFVAITTYVLKRVPDARERASEAVSVWLSTGSHGRPEPHSLLDGLVDELAPRR